MDRRSFLIGAGSILTTAFVEKASCFIRNKAVVLIVEPTEQMTKLYFVPKGNEFDLRLGSPDFGIEDLTYREVLDRYYGVCLPKEEPVTLSQFREIYHDWGITPRMLDQKADLMEYIDALSLIHI